jgi:hypothetical protein
MERARVGIMGLVVILVVMMTSVVAVSPVAARLAPPGNRYDRQAVVNECWYAMTGQPYTCGGKWYKGYLVSAWNYMASDMSALRIVGGWYQWRTYAGWSPYYTYYINPSYGYYGGVGRGGQCKFFVNLILYRSEADQRLLPSWSTMWNNYSAPVDNVREGDLIFNRKWYSSGWVYHIAIVVYRGSTNVGLIESNYIEPCWNPQTQCGIGEIISYRSITINELKTNNYRIYTGVDYYYC